MDSLKALPTKKTHLYSDITPNTGASGISNYVSQWVRLCTHTNIWYSDPKCKTLFYEGLLLFLFPIHNQLAYRYLPVYRAFYQINPRGKRRINRHLVRADALLLGWQ